MTVIDWLLDSDPAIRWQVMGDLLDAPADVVAAERAKVATEGWGARLLALQEPDGLRVGERACFPSEHHFEMDDAEDQPSRWNTLRALRVLRWWEAPHGSVGADPR